MKTILAILFVAASASAQYRNSVDPRQAAILQEARYLSGDGSFGSAYVQEDGTDFKEETAPDGTRRGQYSYIDPNGKKITVSYTAGKDGFQVSGDHLPKAPAPLPVAAPTNPPVPQYNPAPQYNAIPQQQQQYQNYQNPASTYNYNQNNYQQQPQQYNSFAQQQPIYTTTTTPAPRFFPPGKLNLNRTPDGYQYSFSTN